MGGIGDGGQEREGREVFEYRERTWEKRESMRIGKRQFGVCYLKGCIYTFGGRLVNGEVTASCEKYVIKEDRWLALPAMNTPRSSMAVCRYNHDDIYIIFGAEGNQH